MCSAERNWSVREVLNKSSSAGQQIFCPIRAVLEMGNTYSIPPFPELSAEPKSSAASSCRFNQSFPNKNGSSEPLFRVSKKPPTVKMQVLTVGDFIYFRRISNRKTYFSELVKSPCCARHFDLLRKPPSTVPMYADECGLLVLAAPLTSASLSKNKFFDRLNSTI